MLTFERICLKLTYLRTRSPKALTDFGRTPRSLRIELLEYQLGWAISLNSCSHGLAEFSYFLRLPSLLCPGELVRKRLIFLASMPYDPANIFRFFASMRLLGQLRPSF